MPMFNPKFVLKCVAKILKISQQVIFYADSKVCMDKGNNPKSKLSIQAKLLTEFNSFGLQ